MRNTALVAFASLALTLVPLTAVADSEASINDNGMSTPSSDHAAMSDMMMVEGMPMQGTHTANHRIPGMNEMMERTSSAAMVALMRTANPSAMAAMMDSGPVDGAGNNP